MVSFCTYSSKIILKYFTISYAIVNDLMSFSNFCQYIIWNTFFWSVDLISWNLVILIYRCYYSVTKSCLTLCDPMDCSIPGFPVPHHLPEFAQVHVHWISDAIPTISSSVTLFSFCLQSFPATGSFPLSWLFTSGGSIGASTSPSVLYMYNVWLYFTLHRHEINFIYIYI